MKVFDPELIERFGETIQRARVERELSLCGKYHPGLVKILDGGRCPCTGYFFIVMECINAPTLAAIIESIPRERIWPLIAQIAGAALYLEGLGLVHRDIKPENIAVSRDFGNATLLDLGVIRPIGFSNLTDREKQDFVGTLRYSSPEFLFREEEDSLEGWRALTFYQLGAVLHDMVMRRPLFGDFTGPYARLVKAVEQETPRIKAADVPADLVLLARNCLVKLPEVRLQLVSWSDFETRAARPSSSSDAIVRIQKRRILARSAVAVPAARDEENRTRIVQRVLGEVRKRLQDAIRHECIGSDLFPPMEVHDHAVRQDEAHFQVVFCASAEHGLCQPLSIWFNVKLLDHSPAVIRLQCAAALSNMPLGKELDSEQKRVTLFRGVLEEAVIRRALRDTIYLAIDQAQQVDPGIDTKQGGETEPLWLEIQTPEGE